MTPRPLEILQHYSRLYPRAWEQAAMFRASKGKTLKNWADYVYLPVAGAYAIVGSGQELSPAESDKVMDVSIIAALAAWRMTRGIYRFDETIFQALWDTPIDSTIPVEVLYRLPEWCVYIETPSRVNAAFSLRGFFAYLDEDANTGAEELRIVADLDVGLLPFFVHLTHGTLREGVEASLIEARHQARKHGAAFDVPIEDHAKEQAGVLAPLVSLLLYLCSLNSEIRDEKGTDRRPRNPGLTKTRRGKKLIPAQSPTIWDVGFRLGAAIRHAHEQERGESANGTHASPRTHVRRAHWHSYWIGKRDSTDRNIILKWLPPIAVNVDDEELPVVFREVK
ncbi:MAG: hypothetical protein HY231_23700 [Acidobacteria bacterium]|nr:hypothetical protein [Acidobacteriota bacterium]